MLRLIRNGLMYANLVEVSSPALVARYNRALEKLTGRRTALESFHIDMSGFAPEIGEEFGDANYLNPEGCNRQFILLSLAQMRAPLIDPHFSSSPAILRRFLAENEDELFALTSREPVVGELLNSIYRVTSLREILDLRAISVELETVGGTIAARRDLAVLVERFKSGEEAWYDDALIARMIALADRLGEGRKDPPLLNTGPFQVDSFYTAHFGGLYVFRGAGGTTVLHAGPAPQGDGRADATLIGLHDRAAVADFLRENSLVETVFEAVDLDDVDLLRHRRGCVLIEHLARTVEGWSYSGESDLRGAAYRNVTGLPELFHTLSDRLRCREQGVDLPPLYPAHADYFYCLRARPGPLQDLVNMLLAELTPLDPRQLYICHKRAFYRIYAGWPDAMRDYVVAMLLRDYLPDKPAARLRLYGRVPRSRLPVWARGATAEEGARI